MDLFLFDINQTQVIIKWQIKRKHVTSTTDTGKKGLS